MTTSSKNVVAVHLTSVMPASLLFLKSDFLGIRGDFKGVRKPCDDIYVVLSGMSYKTVILSQNYGSIRRH